MAKPPIKYNPAFLTDDELAAAFVVRQDDLDSILRVVRENTAESNQHVLVVGPRGIGKTMLVRRVSLAVRRDEELRQVWYPLVFAEESYEVGTAGEFWLESLFHLANQTGDAQWLRTYEGLRQEPVEDRLCERALAQLLDFADLQGKRILLVVENLNMILSDQLKEADAWRLRKTLMHEPRLMLLATATARLDGPQNLQKAMYELFKTQELHPLDDADCQAIWRSIAGHDLGPRRIRAISILTGGSPRLLAIISHFGARMSFSELMQDMTGLVDDHTDYFKSHLDALPATERKVYVALTDLWDPSTARDVAVASRQSVSQASAMLRRLVTRGAVIEAPGKGRTKRYQVAERMYNIYYLMRRRGTPSERVKVAVQFMVQFYEETEIVEVTRRLSEEACGLAREDRQDHYHAFESILKTAPAGLVPDILQCTPRRFLDAPDRPESLRQWLAEAGFGPTCPCNPREHRDERIREFMAQGHHAARTKHWGDSEQAYRKAIGIDPAYPEAWLRLGQMLARNADRVDEAESALLQATKLAPRCPCCWDALGRFLTKHADRLRDAGNAFDRALNAYPDCADAWIGLAKLSEKQSGGREKAAETFRKAEDACARKTLQYPDDALHWGQLAVVRHQYTGRFAQAEDAYRKVTELEPGNAHNWLRLGELLQYRLKKYGEAEEAYRKAIELGTTSARAWTHLGGLLHEKDGRYQEAEAAYRTAIAIEPTWARVWRQLGLLLHEELGRSTEAEEAFRKAISLEPQHACNWVYLGSLLYQRMKRYPEAEGACRKAIELNPNLAWAWLVLGRVLREQPDRYQEAAEAYRKATRIDQKYVSAWALLGQLLHERPEYYAEAENAYLSAIDADPTHILVWKELVEFVLTGRKEQERALQLAEKALLAVPSNADLLNSLAWTFYDHGPVRYLAVAEGWSRRSAEPGAANAYTHTLACVLAREEKADEALVFTGKLLDAPEYAATIVDDMVTLFAELVAAGVADKALAALRDSKSAKVLEPVLVALEMELEMEIHVAPEIAEVAKDVRKRFKEVRARRIEERKG